MFLTTEKSIFSFDKKNTPAVTVASGTTLEIETMDCFSNQLRNPSDTLDNLDWDRVNPATGPIFVEGAEPGDALKVTIEKIVVNEKGVVACMEDEGTVGHMLCGTHIRITPIEQGMLKFNDDVQIPIKPMIGVIGVAPDGEGISCGTPGTHGGNMDNTMVCQGATLYFPVAVEGALFALGDLHAVMGDGEIGVCGLEIPGVVTVTLEVIKGKAFQYPVLETEDKFSVIVSKLTVDEAITYATELMVQLLESRTSMERPDIVMLMSLVGNVEICQVVDPLRTVRFVVPKKYFKGLTF